MKFRKFGKALLMGALSIGAVLSVTSCVESYTVGYLYVTGTQTTGTSGSPGQGIISGFKIDHNTGQLRPINGMPVSSGGSYPGRAVLMLSSRFLYVLNQGGSDCTTNPADTDCEKANIVQFSIGGNGILVPQQTFYTQGKNPFRIIADTSGQHIYVLDHDAPDNSSCALALGASFTTCGDITGFTVESSTGRLSLMTNAQVSSSNGTPLTYFPVPSNSIDMLFSGSYMFILSGTPDTGDFVFPYAYANGQLTVSQNSIQQIGTTQATAITTGNSFIYILDNEPITIPADTTGPFNPGVYPTQILPWTVGAGGGLQAATGGTVPGVANETNPMFLLATTKAVYVANQGDIVNFNPANTQSGIAGYVIDTSTHQLTPMSNSPFGSGNGPTCLVEDPSSQYVYTANYNDSSVTGRSLDQNTGELRALPGNANKAYPLNGPASYCLINGRTS